MVMRAIARSCEPYEEAFDPVNWDCWEELCRDHFAELEEMRWADLFDHLAQHPVADDLERLRPWGMGA